MALMRSALALALLVPLVAGHGTLTKPVARQMLIAPGYGVGLTNPGAGQCDISIGNHMNMNGCQGAGGVVDFQTQCWVACNGQLASEEAACVECKDRVVSEYKAGGTIKPAPQVGVCGDLYWRNAFSTNFSSDACKDLPGEGSSCIEKALNQPFSELTLDPTDNSIEVETTITAHHYGWSEFRLCRQGGRGKDGLGVTQECFNQDVLKFDVAHARELYGGDAMKPGVAAWSEYTPKDPSDYVGTHPSVRCDGPGADVVTGQKLQHPEIWAPEGSCCNKGGDCGAADVENQDTRWVFPSPSAATDSKYKVKVFLPAGLTCTQENPCTMQWLFMTGNSPNSYPEAFRNCADFKLATSTPGATEASTSAAPASSSSASATVEPEPTPQPEPEPEPETTAAPTTAAPTTPAPTTAAPTTAAPTTPAPTTAAPTTAAPSTAAPTTDAPSTDGASCIDVFSNPCGGCLATNNVCYAESKAWCDQWASYTWCGASLGQAQAPGRKLRGSRRL
jgi:hypothetical protein